MNRCEKFIDKLSEHIDNELPYAESAAVRGHIESCPFCQDEFKLLQTAKHTLKSLPHKTASDEVKKRILGRVSGKDLKNNVFYLPSVVYFKRKGMGYKWMALAASILLFIFITISDTTSSPVKVYVLEHQRCMSEGHRDYLCKTEHEFSQKVERSMGAKAFIPSYFPEGFKFIKGDVCKIKGITVAHMVMGDGKRILSYFQGKGEIMKNRDIHAGRLEKSNYAYWKKDGVYCIVVGDVDDGEMIKIASSQPDKS